MWYLKAMDLKKKEEETTPMNEKESHDAGSMKEPEGRAFTDEEQVQEKK